MVLPQAAGDRGVTPGRLQPEGTLDQVPRGDLEGSRQGRASGLLRFRGLGAKPLPVADASRDETAGLPLWHRRVRAGAGRADVVGALVVVVAVGVRRTADAVVDVLALGVNARNEHLDRVVGTRVVVVAVVVNRTALVPVAPELAREAVLRLGSENADPGLTDGNVQRLDPSLAGGDVVAGTVRVLEALGRDARPRGAVAHHPRVRRTARGRERGVGRRADARRGVAGVGRALLAVVAVDRRAGRTAGLGIADVVGARVAVVARQGRSPAADAGTALRLERAVVPVVADLSLFDPRDVGAGGGAPRRVVVRRAVVAVVAVDVGLPVQTGLDVGHERAEPVRPAEVLHHAGGVERRERVLRALAVDGALDEVGRTSGRRVEEEHGHEGHDQPVELPLHGGSPSCRFL